MNRPFRWRTVAILVGLYFLGNLAGVPLLVRTGVPIEPFWFWGVATLISAVFISLSLWMATRSGLGVLVLEGYLCNGEFSGWLRNGLALTVLMLVVAMPFSLIVNLEVDASSYPWGWELLLASFKAGTVEELVNRFFLMTLFVWLGKFFLRNGEGHPTKMLFWVAILLTGLIFGWAHVDARLGNPNVALWWYVMVMILNSGLGIFFGWLYWRLGLECAILAHFLFDVFLSMVLIPIYLLKNPLVWVLLIIGLVSAGVFSSRYLLGKFKYS